MRRYLLTLCALCVVGAPSLTQAGSFNAQGQFVGAVSPVITALLAQFPAGGAGLRAAIAYAVQAGPSLAADGVFAAQSGNASQKEAIRSGLADAASFFAKTASASALQAGGADVCGISTDFAALLSIASGTKRTYRRVYSFVRFSAQSGHRLAGGRSPLMMTHSGHSLSH